ncbi:M16 family metallopeptidase [Flexibacterium corallicola]|uniref:M16 family metallopeptidase n=1 Tax=Flexibacterium corallicola TaxID=3037259 RepID=UPI00286EC4FA|nr:pitrilysin family protein [Pseudovibrio sp. M1P-2-3]
MKKNSLFPLVYAQAICTCVLALLLFPVAFLQTAKAFEIQEVTSKSGIKAWLVENYSVPIIAMEFSFQGGSTQDPKEQLGLTNLLSYTLDEGAGDLNSQQYQLALEDLTMSVGFRAGKDRFYGSMRTLQPNLTEAVEMLRLAINEPRFDPEPVEKIKSQIITGIRRAQKQPDAIAARALSQMLFPNHPYGQTSLGTEASVSTLTSQNLRDLKAKLFARQALNIGVVGAINAEQLAEALDKVFSKLPEKALLQTIPDIIPVEGEKQEIAFKAPQSTIQFALPGLERTDPTFIPAYVMNHILGGGSFTSWLYEEVREERGLVYSIGTYLVPYEHSALLMGATGTRSENTEKALAIIEEQLARMGTDGPTEEELQKAKGYITGSYALNFDSSGAIALQLVGIQNADLGIDYISERNDKVNAVTLDQVRSVASELLKDKKPSIVVVGPIN